MKKILSVLLSCILLSLPSFAVDGKTQNWYFSSKSQNDRPSLPALPEALGKGIGKDEKVVYFTFDVGYENGNVKKTVDILKEKGVTGTFFVLKHFVEDKPELCKEITANGNLIASHTASHRNIASLSDEEIRKELTALENIYRDATGQELSPYFRPPEGAYSEKALQTVADAGYKTLFWSLAWEDWDNNNQKSPEYAMNKLLSRVHNGAVILLHPTSDTNCKILGTLIDCLKKDGYRFGTAEELWDS